MIEGHRQCFPHIGLTGGTLIHVIREKATSQQMAEMLEDLENYVKLAVDVERRIPAGGGTLHADCETALVEAGSQQKDVWGADWIPASQEVRYESLINLRPGQGIFLWNWGTRGFVNRCGRSL